MYVATYTTCTERRKNTDIDTFVRRCTYSTSCTFVPSKVLSYFRTSLILRRYCTVCSYVRVQYTCTWKYVRKYLRRLLVLSYFRTKYESTFKIVHTKKVLIRKYFRTKVRKYESTFESTFVLSKVFYVYVVHVQRCTVRVLSKVRCTFVLSYFRTKVRKYFRKYESTFLYSDLHSTFVQCYIHVYSCTRTRAVQ